MKPGERLGPYEILAPIGKGGMGEVWKARDTRLGRDVAIKISAEQFSERFEREARAVAALNHPNICTLYDVGPNYLVMEYIEGATLAERIKEGPIPLEEALAIARHVADALDAAHEKNIIHRDLKPGNIKIKPDGTVKVLDFGLAKIGGTPTAGKAEDSPTLTLAATQAGMILGTAAYMSPEQARGKEVDKRADIWAFGVVLYEMVTGRQLFEGETVSDMLAAVLRKEPDWEQVPVQVRRLLKRCLEKDPKRRLRDIGDLWELLDKAPQSTATSRSRLEYLGWIAAAVLAIIALGISFAHFRAKPPEAEQPVRFDIAPPEGGRFTNPLLFAVSPDGRRLAFQAVGKDGIRRIWVHSLDSAESHPLAGTEGINIAPWWSPDSHFVAFIDKGHFVKMDATGGPAEELCDLRGMSGGWHGGTWSKDYGIIFGYRTIFRCSVSGGAPTPLTTIDPSRQEVFHGRPVLLPDGRHFFYLRYSRDPEMTGISVGSLDAKPEAQDRKLLLTTQFGVAYAPSSNPSMGHLLFLRESTLMAQPFDLRRLELSGEPARVAEQVGNNNNVFGFFSAAENGTLAYRRTASANSQLTWFDRQGKLIGQAGEPAPYQYVVLSPDETRAARSLSQGFILNPDIWLLEFARGVSTRFTFHRATFPVWSPDGTHVAFSSSRAGPYDLYQKASNGAGDDELLFKSTEGKTPTSWSADGRFLLYTAFNPKTKSDLWVLPLQGDRKPIPLLRSDYNEAWGRFSPDSRWIAYQSDDSGMNEIYVQPLDLTLANAVSLGPGKTLISKGGGIRPVWRRDGKELFYQAPDRKVMAVEVTTKPALQVGSPKLLFQVPDAESIWDVSADGKRFLVPVPVTESAQTPITVLLNWQSGLKK